MRFSGILIAIVCLQAQALAQTERPTVKTDEKQTWVEQVLGDKAWNKSLTEGAIVALRDKYKTDPAFRIDTFEQARAEHHDGDGKRAHHLFSQLADVADHTPSMMWLARMAYRGEGQTIDKVQAFKWTQKAATLGNQTAMAQVGGMYLEGEGVEKSASSARHWFLHAADRGSKDADAILLKMFDEGLGGAVDKKMARVFAKRLVQSYEPDGLYYMGLLYMNDDGEQQDLAKARKMLEAADEYGHENAKSALDKLRTMEATK